MAIMSYPMVIEHQTYEIFQESEFAEALENAELLVASNEPNTVLVKRYCGGCGDGMYGDPLHKDTWVDRCEHCGE
jgi:hypothetical protein